MYENLRGKKLLILGSDFCDRLIVETAQSLGVYVIAADGKIFSDGTPAKQTADEHWDIDYTKLDILEQKCRVAGVDGVLAGYSEFRVLNACRLANRLGLPFYATEEQIELTRNKHHFKELCSKCGICIPDYFCIRRGDSVENIAEKASRLGYPVVVKAVDNVGRKGMTICKSFLDLEAAVNKAQENSYSGEAIIEKQLVGTEIAVRYVIDNGKATLANVGEIYLSQESDGIRLTDLMVSPSKKLRSIIVEADHFFQNFFVETGIKNGIACFQGIYTEQGFFCFEIGFRLGFGNEFVFLEPINHTNYMKMMISYALTGSMGDGIEKNNPFYSGYCSRLDIHVHGCELATLQYTGETTTVGILKVLQLACPGSVIRENGTIGQTVFSFFIQSESRQQLAETIEYIQDHLVLLDTKGESPIFRRMDISRINSID